MKLTDQQREAVNHNGNSMLIACPGSGKTRTIIAKMLRCIDLVKDTPRRVVCITYTNTAVDEIIRRLKFYGLNNSEDYCEVSTIHSFCLNNILRFFYWKLKDFQEGFIVLPSDSEVYLDYVSQMANKHGLNTYQQQSFESFNRKPNGEPITTSDIPKSVALEFWDILNNSKYIDFCNIVYLTYKLLSDNPSLVQNISSKFAYFLIDEFQDTTSLQVEIFKMISNVNNSNFFLVGDPEQSIYGFAGAEKDLMFQFADYLEAKYFPISGNFRSSPNIISLAESLIPRNPPMFSSGESSIYTEKPSITNTESINEAITDYFLPMVEDLGIPLGDSAILAPTYFNLLPLGKFLREYGVAVVGPGARPYKKRHLFASFAEQICAYIENPESTLLFSIERELFFLIQSITGKADFRIYSYEGRVILFKLLSEGQRLRNENPSARDWLINASNLFNDILLYEEYIPESCNSLIPESVSNMLQNMQDNKIDILNLTLSDLGMFANPRDNLKLLTMHGAKGREFSAVGIISLHDGRVPYHNKYYPLTEDGEAEAKRLLYVSITRAKRLLMIFTHNDDWRPPCRFLPNIKVQ